MENFLPAPPLPHTDSILREKWGIWNEVEEGEGSSRRSEKYQQFLSS